MWAGEGEGVVYGTPTFLAWVTGGWWCQSLTSNSMEELIFHTEHPTTGSRKGEVSLTLPYPIVCHGQMHEASLRKSAIQPLWEIPGGPARVQETEWSLWRRYSDNLIVEERLTRDRKQTLSEVWLAKGLTPLEPYHSLFRECLHLVTRNLEAERWICTVLKLLSL